VRRPGDERGPGWLGQCLALGAAYAGSAVVARALAPGSRTAFVWPAPGLGLAALALGGPQIWPGIAAGVVVAAVLVLGVPPMGASAIATVHVLAVLAGSYALRRCRDFHPALDRLRDVMLLLAVGAMSCAFDNLSDVVGFGVAPPTAGAWAERWAIDLLSVVALAPLILTWARGPRGAVHPAQLAEIAALGALTLTLSWLAFASPHRSSVELAVLQPWLLFPPLMWAAVRFGVRGGVTAMVGVGTLATFGASTGRGAFGDPPSFGGPLGVQVFLGAMFLGALVLGAVVSERRSADFARARLAAIVESSADAILGESLDGTITSWNTAAARLFGRTPAEALGQPVASLIAPEGRAEVVRLLDRARRGERCEGHETTACCSDGRSISVALSLSPVCDPAGAVVGTSVIARDLTNTAEQLRLALDAVDLGMWFWNLQDGHLSWTPPCRAMHGIGADDEVTLERWHASLHPEDRGAAESAVMQAVEACSDYRIEYRVALPDGTVRWISARGRVLGDEARKPIRALGAALDVTPQKEAAKAKDEFLAVLSHELRTPLQAMLGWTALLGKHLEDRAALRKGLAVIERNARTQAKLIEDLLDVSRIVANKLRLERRQVDLAEVVEGVLEMARVSAAARSIHLAARIDRSVGAVLGDAVRLQQVASNLLTNALKFTPEGGCVGVRLERTDTAATLTVEDSGCGIPQDLLPHIFDRFRQAEGSTTRRHGGLGLGLAIVRHLVEAHGGNVKADSRGEGRGATFTVTLPLLPAETPRLDRERPHLADASAPLRGLRVLVVDDDPDARELVAAVMHEEGAKVEAVASARAALEAVAVFRPDVLLADIAMPEQDGYALIRELRARESASGGHLPAVALTAFAGPAERERALAVGFQAHLPKPASPQDLATTVASLAGRTGPAPS
jgi:PAS domain S-box-containing protein